AVALIFLTGRRSRGFQPTRRSPPSFMQASARLGEWRMNKSRIHAQPSRAGFAFGLLAYGLWGVLPLYFRAIAAVAPFDIVAHQVLWYLPFLALLIGVSKGSGHVRKAIGEPRNVGMLLLTASLIGANWLLYVYAVNGG